MVVVEEKDEVEVAGVAELFAAEFPVGDHGEVGRFGVAAAKRAPDNGKGEVEHRIGKRREVVA